jgi:3-phenylpropionate/cinnamic acid dioxygenase small subunit
VLRFLYLDAELLDDRRFDQWLALLTEDMSYAMPTRATVHQRDGLGFGPTAGGLYDENRATLEARLRKPTISTSAWAEDPAPKTRRFVSNVRVWRSEDGSALARSYVLMTTFRGGAHQPQLVVAERRDTLRETEGGLRLSGRMVMLDQTSVPAISLQLPL